MSFPIPTTVVDAGSVSQLKSAIEGATGPLTVRITQSFSGNATIAQRFDAAIFGSAAALTSRLTFTGEGRLYVRNLTVYAGCLHARDISGALYLDGEVNVLSTPSNLDGLTANGLIVMARTAVSVHGGAAGRGVKVYADLRLLEGAALVSRGGAGALDAGRGGSGLEADGELSLGLQARLLSAGGFSSSGNGGDGIRCTQLFLRDLARVSATGGDGVNQGGSGIVIGPDGNYGSLLTPPGEFPFVTARGGGKQNAAPAAGGNGIVLGNDQDGYAIGDFTADASYRPGLVNGLPAGYVVYNQDKGGTFYVLDMLQPEPIDRYYGNGVNGPANTVFLQEAVRFTLTPSSLTLVCGNSAEVAVVEIVPAEGVYKALVWTLADSSVASVAPSPDGLSAAVTGVSAGQTHLTLTLLRPGCGTYAQTIPVTVTCGRGAPDARPAGDAGRPLRSFRCGRCHG